MTKNPDWCALMGLLDHHDDNITTVCWGGGGFDDIIIYHADWLVRD